MFGGAVVGGDREPGRQGLAEAGEIAQEKAGTAAIACGQDGVASGDLVRTRNERREPRDIVDGRAPREGWTDDAF